MELSDEKFEETILKSEKPSMVQFWADWCGPCRMLTPLIRELSSELQNINVKRIDVDSHSKYAAKYGIRNIPTVLFFENGALVNKQVGVVPKSVLLEKVEPLIEKYEQKLVLSTEFIGLALIEDRIKLVSYSKDGKYKFLDQKYNSHQIFYSLEFESRALKESIEELEYLVNNENTKENDLQDFFERHQNFIIEDKYKAAHSKIILENDENKKYIPDFVLEPIGTENLCDILDLKMPSSRVFIMKKNRPRYSAAVLEAAAQLREYSNVLETRSNREKITNKYGLSIYKPRMIVVIGRKGNFDPLVIRRLQTDLPNLELRTYDSILERMKHQLDK